VRHKRRGKSNREIAFEMWVSVSIVKSYWLTHGEYLPMRKRGEKGEGVKRKGEGDSKRSKNEIGARRLEKVIEQVYGIHIPHNRIHNLKKDWQRKNRRRKPHIRYEREHSMSAAHIDWFEKDGMKFCAILMMLQGKSLQQENSRMLTQKTA